MQPKPRFENRIKAVRPEPVELEAPIPHSPDAEEAVLGSILIDRDIIFKVAPALRPADFFNTERANLYTALIALYEKKVPGDMVTVVDQLNRLGLLGEADGQVKRGYLISLMRATATPVHAEYYAGIVRFYSFLRKLISAGANVSAMGFNPGLDPEEITEQSTREIQEVINWYQTGRSEKYVMGKDELTNLEFFEKSDDKRTMPLLFGWPGLDGLDFWQPPQVLFERSTLTTVVADTGAGKTSVMLQIAKANAGAGYKAMFFHNELGQDIMKIRLYSSMTEIPYIRLKTKTYSEEEAVRITTAAARISEWPGRIDFIHCPRWPAERIANEIRARHQREVEKTGKGYDAFFLDYIHRVDYLSLIAKYKLMEASAIGESVKAISEVANELGMAGLIGSQMSRDDKDSDHAEGWLREPKLEKCKGSSAIEQLTNVVLGINRNKTTNEAKIIVLKNNNGPTPTLPLTFYPERFEFD